MNWDFHNAEWELFKEISEKEMLEIEIGEDVDQLNTNVCRVILEAVERTIKRKEGKGKKRMVPWWNKECSKAIKSRNKAFRRLKGNHRFENLIEYKRSQANVRRTIKNARKTCWRNFCNSVGRETELGQIWGMIKKMNGVKREYGYPVLKVGETIAMKEEEKGEMLAKAFVKVHSSENISEEGKRGREATLVEYEVLMQDEEENEDLLNKTFTMTEMNRALRKTKMTAPGKDQVCYIMISNLSEAAKGILLELYNRVWKEGKLPESWKEAVIVPIPKPGKDSSNPENYRPIALTSNICKIMEKMINERLTYYMESKGFMSKYQSGFRKGRNTMDPTICLEHEIRKAQINKESVVAVFFDIEKAYDMMWVEGLLVRLRKLGVKGRIYRWIEDFLTERSIQVRVGKSLSGKFKIENGTPQGSIISPLLFSIMINEVFEEIESGMGFSLFADDGAIWKRGKNLKFIVKKLQEAINRVEEWSYKWGFKFSVGKTNIMFFTRKRVGDEIKLKLYKQDLKRVKHFKLLGMWFDERLTWNIHIQKVVDKCKKVINIMRCLVGKEWGADRVALKGIYDGLIRAFIDYGSVVYGAAAETHMKKLEGIQNQALRLCTGGFKTTPIAALQVEMGVMPIDLRRLQLSLTYWVHLQGHSKEHPAQDTLKPSWEKEKKEVRNFGWTAVQRAKEIGIEKIQFSPTVPISALPPWILPDATVDLTILERKNKDREFVCNAISVQEYIDKFYGYVKIYTDGSKSAESKVGVAFWVPEFQVRVGKRVNDEVSVYTAEMIAILLAIHWVEETRPVSVIICSDSSSVLTSLQSSKSDSRPDILIEIKQILYRIEMMGITVVFVWVPAHIGVRGNEVVDKVAKEATKCEEIELRINISKMEGKNIIKRKMKEKWQKRWEEERKGRWFYKIQRKVGEARETGRSRREETVISRLRFGHTGLNASLFIVQKHDTGRCDHCEEQETVDHVMNSCRKYEVERRQMQDKLAEIKERYELVNILRKMSGDRCYRHVFGYLKETHLIKKI